MIAPVERTSTVRRQFAAGYAKDRAGLWADIPAFTAFAQEVHEVLLAGQLLYSQRQKVLNRATKLGIRKFDANLIIAMVQNRVQGSGFRVQESDGSHDTRGNWRLGLVLAVALVQSLILIGAWWVLG
jgi:hypothetical protein